MFTKIQSTSDNRNGKLSEHISKLAVAAGAAIVTAVGSPVPESLKVWTVLVVVLVIADTFAGVYTAIWTRTVESRKLVEKLAFKGVLYCILMLIGFVPCVMFQSWSVAYAMAFVMVTRETISLIESAKILMQNGKDFGRISTLLDRIGQFLAAGSEHAIAVVEVKVPAVAPTTITTTTTTTETHRSPPPPEDTAKEEGE